MQVEEKLIQPEAIGKKLEQASQLMAYRLWIPTEPFRPVSFYLLGWTSKHQNGASDLCRRHVYCMQQSKFQE